jgi:tetratricopeptide (TPR) repeat protein
MAATWSPMPSRRTSSSAALNGDIVGLAVDKGLLQPVQDTTRASAERFVADAAAHAAGQLPTSTSSASTSSPTSTPARRRSIPELMGNRQLKGDVQQTVWQTCGNALGGIMHGDCADIAELYQVITDKQHRNSIIIGLPEHAACAWAEKQRPGLACVTVLQTGPPLAFTEKELPVCLEKAYKSFDPSMTFDANELPLLLRFSGEVSRSEWSLSWRIFSEPDYAHVMFDVQRDWHFQTYQRGIATMTKLIAAGDDDNANYRELSGLYTFTGQYNLAAEFHRKAIARTTEAVSRLYMTVQLVGHLLNAGQKKEAEAAATDVIDHLLPALKDELGPSYLQVGLQLALVCLNEEGGPALQNIATRALKEIVNKQMSEFIEQVSTWLASSEYKQDVWENSNELRSMRGMIAEYCGIVIELVSRVGADQLPGDADMNLMSGNVQKWLDGIAFHDVEDNSSVLGRYAAAGHWYAAVMGEETFDHLLDGVAPAKNATVKHEKRANGVVQMTKDLPWIRASVPYWYDRMAKLFRRNNDHARSPGHRPSRPAPESRRVTATAALGLSNPDVREPGDSSGAKWRP